MSDQDQDALDFHAMGRPGKIEVVATKPLSTQRHLALAYSPGVAAPCLAIHKNPNDVFAYTAKGNLVAVVTNGTAVLGLGDIGPLAAKPVMEGKANLFKRFADIDVFDIELNARTADEVVAAVTAIAPTFGGINLEDIKAPECFEIETRLQAALDIPVLHDDQHGTAIITAAAMLNAIEVTGRQLATVKFVFSGAGAAAIACAKLFVSLGARVENIVMVDLGGVIDVHRTDLDEHRAAFATERKLASLTEALSGADAFVGLSAGGIVSREMVQAMAPRPILFAMANPEPEISFADARAARPDAIVATGRSDHPNQVNNVLGFPFLFRGALDCRARKINEAMKIAATRALAALAREEVPDSVLKAYDLTSLSFGPDYIIPKPFDPRVLLWVAPAVAEAARVSGVARAPIPDPEAYRERLHRLVERSRGIMQPLIHRAKRAKNVRVVFPDGTNPQVLRAAQLLVDEKLCTPVLLGAEWKIVKRAHDAGVDLTGVEIHESGPGPELDQLAEMLWRARQRKGVTIRAAKAMLSDRDTYGAMLVQQGFADALIGGPGRPYKHTLRPALRCIGLQAGARRVSGVYVMLFRDRLIFFGDCTVNVRPDAETLAEIALNTARVAETFGIVPKVAMLSYSDFGEHLHDDEVRRVTRAIDLVRAAHPDLIIDGEMQADTAVNPEKLRESFPFSALDGPANVLIFPDLTSGNIAYKLLTNLTGVEALGPLLVGVARPVNVIPVHATVAEIVNVTTYTVNQALDRR